MDLFLVQTKKRKKEKIFVDFSLLRIQWTDVVFSLRFLVDMKITSVFSCDFCSFMCGLHFAYMKRIQSLVFSAFPESQTPCCPWRQTWTLFLTRHKNLPFFTVFWLELKSPLVWLYLVYEVNYVLCRDFKTCCLLHLKSTN